ncbi:MAG: AAA family ATPase [Flavobacteriaceae bacterium]
MEKAYKQKPTDLVKVVLFGPESTGKTTLAQELAKHYDTSWVPEYAREYLQNKWDHEKKICELSDLLPIAKGQMRIENSMSEQADQLLICDTDLLETKVYSEIYFDEYCDPVLERYALENTYDLYLLTNIDIPWENDDLRDRPFEREVIFEKFKATLVKYGRNFVILKGDRNQRLNQATILINQHLNR